MPDRRQGDRRESGRGLNSKLEISLGMFIFIIMFVLTVIIFSITCVVVAKMYYNRGYSTGYNQGIEDFRNGNVTYDTAVESGYDEIYEGAATGESLTEDEMIYEESQNQ